MKMSRRNLRRQTERLTRVKPPMSKYGAKQRGTIRENLKADFPEALADLAAKYAKGDA